MLSKRQENALRKIISQVEKIISDNKKSSTSRAKSEKSSTKGMRKGRRTRAEAIALKKSIAAERKRSVPVAELATKYGVTAAYIYMMK